MHAVNPTVAKMAGQIALSLVRSRTGRRLLVAVLVLQLIALTVILWLPAYFASITATSVQRVVTTAPSNCGAETAPTVTDDGSPLPQVADLQPRQVEVARTIYLTALGVGIAEKWSSAKTERAVLVALATAMQESQLGAYPGIDRPNGDGDAGVFQQRQKPGWYGTLAQVTQVGYAARVFLRGKVVSAADVAAARRAGSAPGRTGRLHHPRAEAGPRLGEHGGHGGRAEGAAIGVPRRVRQARADLPDPARGVQGQDRPAVGRGPGHRGVDAVRPGGRDDLPADGPGGGVGAEPRRAAGAPLHRPRAGRRSGPSTASAADRTSATTRTATRST